MSTLSSSNSGLSLFAFNIIRNIKWELYHTDCKSAIEVLGRHGSMYKITGFYYSPFYLVAVEVDMPYGSAEGLGESFRPWTEDVFEPIINSITSGLPHNRLATIVSFVHA